MTAALVPFTGPDLKPLQPSHCQHRPRRPAAQNMEEVASARSSGPTHMDAGRHCGGATLTARAARLTLTHSQPLCAGSSIVHGLRTSTYLLPVVGAARVAQNEVHTPLQPRKLAPSACKAKQWPKLM